MPKRAPLLLLALAFTLVPNAFAYGDPAAGGFMLQVLLAGAFASLAFLRGTMSRALVALRVKKAERVARD